MTRTHVVLAYLLSFHAAAHALLGIAPEQEPAAALGLGGSAVAGAMLYPRISALFDTRQRGRVLTVVWLLYLFILLLLFVGITNGDRSTLERSIDSEKADEVIYSTHLNFELPEE